MSAYVAPGLHVQPITYQSGDTYFTEWITLFTLCLAPLFAHISAGVPRVTLLTNKPPKWHQRISHYNPTSVLWRYAAIIDRRIRAKSWETVDLAASSALFWTTSGWDGSEAMVDLSLLYCSHLPETTRVSIFSQEMLKTMIVTLQAFQSLFLILRVFNFEENAQHGFSFVSSMGLDVIFFPLAIIGLLRLASCLWLTDDFGYYAAPDTPESAQRQQEFAIRNKLSGRSLTMDSLLQVSPRDKQEAVRVRHHETPATDEPGGRRSSVDSLLQFSPGDKQIRYYETCAWSSRIFRLFYISFIWALWIVSVLVAAWAEVFTMTSFLALLFYSFFFGFSSIILSVYFVLGRTTTTIIPCVSSTWYKIYTGGMMVLALVLFVVACVETRQTPCGIYTSYSGYYGDLQSCFKANSMVIPMGPGGSESVANISIPKGFGIAFQSPDEKAGQFRVVGFVGNCLGNVSSPPVRRVASFQDL